MEINTVTVYCRTMNPDMAFSCSNGLGITLSSGVSTGHSDLYAPWHHHGPQTSKWFQAVTQTTVIHMMATWATDINAIEPMTKKDKALRGSWKLDITMASGCSTSQSYPYGPWRQHRPRTSIWPQAKAQIRCPCGTRSYHRPQITRQSLATSVPLSPTWFSRAL